MINNLIMGFYSHYVDSPQLLQTEMAVIGYWNFTWSLHGWRTKLLTVNDIDWTDPEAQAFHEGVKKHPSDLNHPEYNMACWLRWIAFKQYYSREIKAGGHVFCGDYDLFNYGLYPDDPALNEYTKYEICSFTRGWGNCLANMNGLKTFCDACSGELPDTAIIPGESFGPHVPKEARHTSDLYVAAYKLGYLNNGRMRIMDERVCDKLINGAHNLIHRQCDEWGKEYDRNDFMVHINDLEQHRGLTPIPKNVLTNG